MLINIKEMPVEFTEQGIFFQNLDSMGTSIIFIDKSVVFTEKKVNSNEIPVKFREILSSHYFNLWAL